MAYLNDLFERFERLDIDRLSEAAMDASEDEIIEAQINQLMKGQSAVGEGYTYKSPAYASKKRQMNPEAGGRVDARYTGDFHAGLYVEEGTQLIKSRDRKYKTLIEQYPELLGLNEETRRTLFSTTLRPTFQQLIEQATGLSFE